MLAFSSHSDQITSLLQDKENITSASSSEEVITILLVISCGFLLSSLSMAIYMIRHRKQKIVSAQTFKDLQEKYQAFLSGFLLLPGGEAFLGIARPNAMVERLSTDDISDSYKRSILLTEIYQFKKQLSGQHANQLVNYFYGLGLQEDVLMDLNKNEMVNKIKALQMTAAFRIQEFMPKLKNLIKHKNRAVVLHSLLAIITIDNRLDALELMEYKLNKWEMHKLLTLIETKDLQDQFQALIKTSPSTQYMGEIVHFTDTEAQRLQLEEIR